MFIFHDNNLRFMPLSGVFFVSLHHQSNRMTMFKKTDPNPQLGIPWNNKTVGVTLKTKTLKPIS